MMFRSSAVPSAAGRPGAELADLVATIAADEHDWLGRLALPRGAERWWTRLSGDEQVDVWLLSWLPGHSTDLHDHGRSAAAFTVVRGQLTELRQGTDGRLHAFRRPAGSVTVVDPGVVHDVHGSGTGPAVSIHAYSPPLGQMNYYEFDGRGDIRFVRSEWSREPERESA